MGSDLLRLIKLKGLDYIKANLTSWLNAASSGGSGDDVTLGLLCRKDLIPSYAPNGEPLALQGTERSLPGSV